MNNSLVRKGLVLGIIVLFVGAGVIPSMGRSVVEKHISQDYKTSFMGFNPSGNILYVGGTGPGNYSTIQEAIDAAGEGDIILVAPGWYYGGACISKRHLTIVGENRETYINGGFTLKGAYNITIRGFTVTGAIQILRLDYNFSKQISIMDNTLLNWIFMQNSKDNVIANNTITSAYTAIRLDNSWHITITGNLITSNRGTAIKEFFLSTGNTITNNVISDNGGKGIWQKISGYDTITGNTISNNQYGIYIEAGSKNNNIHHNNFINNMIQAYVTTGYTNIWDDGYPSGGNYWSDYNGTDFYSGPYQNLTGSDGIGDTPYNINANNTDRYPFMNRLNPVHNINTGLDYTTIQDAINAPETLDGHTIRVDAWTYYEHMVVNKSVLLVGEDKYQTIVDGNGTGAVINITANNVKISGFTVRHSGSLTDSGIYVLSNRNKISHNIITNNGNGIWLDNSTNNTLTANTISNNQFGIMTSNSSSNAFFHNSFVNNTQQVNSNSSINTWDNGYPSGGNYWSDYNGTDFYSGPYQNLTGSDGIGDTSYIIDMNNKDNYPFINLWGPVHNILTGLNYETIQDAINAPETLDGHTIRVDAGTYYEDVVVNKSVSLIGEQMEYPVLDAAGSWNVVLINADNVNINGFTMLHGAGCGIKLDDSSNNTLTDNTVSLNGGYGIRIMYSNNNTLVGNTFSSNNQDGIELYDSNNNILTSNTVSSNKEYGIDLRGSNDNTLIGNNISNNWYGIMLSNSKNNNLTLNNASNNQYNFYGGGINYVDTSNTVDGKPIYYLVDKADTIIDAQTNAGVVYLINCNNITIRNLTLTENGHGVFFWNTTNSKIKNVSTLNNYCGIWLEYSGNNTLAGNVALNCRHGIWLDDSSNNLITGNVVSSNNWYGISLFGSNNNMIFHNNFINNTHYNAYDECSNTWDDGYPSGGNYWDNYTGVDHYSGPNQDIPGSDGIGDTPYNITGGSNQDRYPLMFPYDEEPPTVKITKPVKALYIFNIKIRPYLFRKPLIIGRIDIKVDASDDDSGIDRVEFYLNNKLKATDKTEPYSWTWKRRGFIRHRLTITVVAYDNGGNNASDEIKVWRFF